ncbi:lipoprotein LpqH [Mycolicibacterium rutilum]|nr:lipoprotein LpqH [Mycolicibacterium rutilum]
MIRTLSTAVGAAALVIAGLAGCSSDDKSTSPTAGADDTARSETAVATPAASDAATKVTIDGQDQSVSGTVVCTAMGGNMNIVIGEAATGIAAVLGTGDSPTVQSVALGNVNGVTLGYQQGAGQGEAKVHKDGDTYTISGTASGVDMANPMQPVSKPFEIKVSCAG